MAEGAAKAYGDALWQLAKEQKNEQKFCKEAGKLLDIMEKNRGLFDLLTAPGISPAEKNRILEETFQDRISEELLGFLVVMVKNERSDPETILHALKSFIRTARESARVGQATIISAVELDCENKEAIEGQILKTSGFETCRFLSKVNPALIGGIIVRIGDRIFDGSVKTQIEKLENSLLQNQAGR